MPIQYSTNRQYCEPAGADNVSVTPSGTGWANSSYVTVLAATDADCVLTGISFYTTYGEAAVTDLDAEIDVATGAASSEVVIATFRLSSRKIFDGAANGLMGWQPAPIGIDAIANGARISVRMRKTDTNTTAWLIGVTFFKKPVDGTFLTTATVMKAIPSAAAGVALTASATPWTSGSWVQVRAASGSALVVVGIAVVNGASGQYEVDLGTGGSGSETVVTTITINATGAGQFPGFLMLPVPLDNIAASARIAARIRSSVISGTIRLSLNVLEKPI